MPYPAFIITEGKEKTCFKIKDDVVSVGRDSTNPVRLVDAGVSRKHCEVSRVSDEYYLTDLWSRNGTLLNGALLSVRKKLKDGDVIEVGGVTIVFKQNMSGAAIFLWWFRTPIVRRVLLLMFICATSFGVWYFLKETFEELSRLAERRTQPLNQATEELKNQRTEEPKN